MRVSAAILVRGIKWWRMWAEKTSTAENMGDGPDDHSGSEFIAPALYPDPAEIDMVNRHCYDELAVEYSADHHETCRDFDRANILLLHEFAKFVPPESFESVLEVGGGPGHLFREIRTLLNLENKAFTALDLSEKMLEQSKKTNGSAIDGYVHGSIFGAQAQLNTKFDLVLGLMCDPYLTPIGFKELASLVKPGGTLILTHPNPAWVKAVGRKEPQKAIFRDRYGNRRVSFSFCPSNEQMIDLCKKNLIEIKSRIDLTFDSFVPNGDLNASLIEQYSLALPYISGLLLEKRRLSGRPSLEEQ